MTRGKTVVEKKAVAKKVEKATGKKVTNVEKTENNLPPVVIESATIAYGISGKEGILDSNEVYDEADIASALERGFIAQALENHRKKVAPESHPDFDGKHCIDCDVLIPEGRLALGKVRCVDCQSELEKYNKIYGRH